MMNTIGRLKHKIAGISVCAFMLATMASCEKKSVGFSFRTYSAYLNEASKTSISPDRKVSWSEGDWIWYYSKDGGILRMFTVEEDCTKAQMTLSVASDANYLIAVHGASSISNYSGNSLTLNGVVKPVQDGSFKDGHVAIAKLTDVNSPSIHFSNLVSFISFALLRNDVTRLVFTAVDGTPLHGNGVINVSFDGDKATPSLQADGSNSIEVAVSGSGQYYIAILPTILKNGFKISCYDNKGTLLAVAEGTRSLSVSPGTIFSLGLLDSHLIDKTGIQIDPYDPDTDHDDRGSSTGTVNMDGYASDYNWDSSGSTDGSVNIGDYPGDSQWDNNSDSNGTVGRNDYNEDANWN